MGDKRKYWFRAKKHGWGWTGPATWQGWLVFVGYLLLLTAAILATHRWGAELRGGVVWFVLGIWLVSWLVLGICFWKGEPPDSRWGGK
ncbi:MAG: hypothetical protein SFV15_21890 [Polyangiaceae bacterium]|nr:hypothetical protein [Polyangiaceae bacterium]